jgi:hypothetical protein
MTPRNTIESTIRDAIRSCGGSGRLCWDFESSKVDVWIQSWCRGVSPASAYIQRIRYHEPLAL